MLNNNTICAIATAPGGAIGIIRVSGPDAIKITDKIFKPVGDQPKLCGRKPYTLAYGSIMDGRETVDEVLVSVFHAPHSYTGEDSVEISCHGSTYILQQVTHLLIKNGCHSAEPGEFTRRAFMNGKMDLSQAEAVADLIGASNRATHHMAISQLKGHFSSELGMLREQLLRLTSLLELELDFSDHEELEFADRSELKELALRIKDKITNLAHSFELGITLKQGIPVAIVGKTNVGKSTLLNRLLHEDKAIVSSVHGTTRDCIEDTTVIDGVTFRFIDTAGIRKTDDEVENIGIERTYKKIAEARIVLWVVDELPTEDAIKNIEKLPEDKKIIVVKNKIDIYGNEFSLCSLSMLKWPVVSISAKDGQNVQSLLDSIKDAANIPNISEESVIVTSARHYDSLTRSLESINRVIDSINIGLSGDMIAEDLRITLDDLAEITGGHISSQATLNNIFKNFCVGK